jgi:tRNA(Ile)-lysidine synthetase-like protein
VGGKLIRRVISELKSLGGDQVEVPLGKPAQKVFLAVSGGLDSTALFLLLAKYGRRIAQPDALRVLHVNHGWREEASDGDEEFVCSLASEFNVPVEVLKAERPKSDSSRSWEDHARDIRRGYFQEVITKNPGSWVLTAHQADDQAETLLWRLFTGTLDTHGAGILRVHPELRMLRPLLGIRRKELQDFLEEEGRSWRKDQTNLDARFLRARMRLELIPVLEGIFPQAIERLLLLSPKPASKRSASSPARVEVDRAQDFLNLFWGSAGLSLRRPHVKHMLEVLATGEKTRVDLPGGWSFRKEGTPQKDRWVLERTKGR